MKSQLLRKLVCSVATLALLIMLTACAGVGTNANGPVSSITGTITNVNAANHSVTLSVGSQTYTVNGLSDQEMQTLQGQTGNIYTLQVTQNSDGSYSITVGTNPTQANNATPGTNVTPVTSATPNPNATPETTGTTNITGNFILVGPVQSVSSNSLTVTMPDTTSLTVTITTQTDQSGLHGAQLSVGQQVKVAVVGDSNGLSADEIKIADSGDLADANTIDFQGTTTQAVGSDNVLHFNVGNHAFSYILSRSANLDDFNGNASNITNGTPVKVRVQFDGTTGNVTRVKNNA